MSQQFTVQVYQINAMDPIPLGSVPTLGFPSAGVMLRSNPTATALLSTGVYVYGIVQIVTSSGRGSVYYTLQTQAQLAALANS